MNKQLFAVSGLALFLAACGTTPPTTVELSSSTLTLEQREKAARTIFSLSPEVAQRIETEASQAADPNMRALELLLVESQKISPQAAYSIFGRPVTSAEISLCAWAAATCLTTYNLSNEAQSAANVFGDGSWGGRNDAFRHAYWNALMTSQINEDWAQRYANAHESETPDGPDRAMDFHNNQVGRNEGRYYGPGEPAKNTLRSIIYNDVITGRTLGFCGDKTSYTYGYNYYTGSTAVNCNRY